MKLASHNSMTYLPVSCWWMRPFNFLSKCQQLDIHAQLDAGVSYFDFRVRWDKHGDIVFAHGLAEYHSEYLIDILRALNRENGISVRLTLELSKRNCNQEERFIGLCKKVERYYPHIRFLGGCTKKGWRQLYDFENAEPSLFQWYQSYHNDKPHVAFFPRLWALRNNPKGKALAKGHDYLMMDFIKQ